jgi:hypothetical protein
LSILFCRLRLRITPCHSYQGLLQHIFGLTVFPPVGVGPYVLAQRILTRTDSESDRIELESSQHNQIEIEAP